MKIIDVVRNFEKEWKNILRHQHDEIYQIDYFLYGKGIYWVKDCWKEINDGDVFFMPPYVEHQINCDGNHHIDNFSIKFILEKDERLKSFSMPSRVNIQGQTNKKFVSDIRKLMGYFIMNKPAENYLKNILTTIQKALEKNKEPQTTQEKIEKVINFLKVNYSEPVRLSFVSEKVKLNQYYLCRAFKKATGQTIFQYLTRIRMENSLHMLRNTKISIKDVAYKCGFKNVYYFTTLFTKTFSIPPGKIRKNKGSPENK